MNEQVLRDGLDDLGGTFSVPDRFASPSALVAAVGQRRRTQALRRGALALVLVLLMGGALVVTGDQLWASVVRRLSVVVQDEAAFEESERYWATLPEVPKAPDDLVDAARSEVADMLTRYPFFLLPLEAEGWSLEQEGATYGTFYDHGTGERGIGTNGSYYQTYTLSSGHRLMVSQQLFQEYSDGISRQRVFPPTTEVTEINGYQMFINTDVKVEQFLPVKALRDSWQVTVVIPLAEEGDWLNLHFSPFSLDGEEYIPIAEVLPFVEAFTAPR